MRISPDLGKLIALATREVVNAELIRQHAAFIRVISVIDQLDQAEKGLKEMYGDDEQAFAAAGYNRHKDYECALIRHAISENTAKKIAQLIMQ